MTFVVWYGPTFTLRDNNDPSDRGCDNFISHELALQFAERQHNAGCHVEVFRAEMEELVIFTPKG